MGLWNATGSLATSRCYHRAVRLLDGRVLAVAGYNGGYLTSCEIWDPATGLWSATGSLLGVGVYWPGLALNPLTGKVYLLGGWTPGGTLDQLQEWDPATGLWSAKTAPGRAFAAGAWLWMPGSGRFLMAGGADNVGASRDVKTYNPATDTWTTHALLPYGFIYSDGIYAGGRAVLPQHWSGIGAFVQEVVDGSFTSSSVGSLSADRTSNGTHLLPNGDVLVWGGAGSGVLLPANNTADIWRPGVGLVGATTNNMSVVRGYNYAFTPGASYQGKAVVCCGYQNAVPYATTATDLYDPATGLWSATDPMLAPRGVAPAVTLADGRVLVIGGYDDTPAFLTTCEIYGVVAPTVKPWLGAIHRRRAA